MDHNRRIVVACGLITDGERVLISRRLNQGSFPNCWELPGGKPEGEESLEAAVVREIEEELGVLVRVVRQVARVNYPHGEDHITLEVFLCHLNADAQPECREVAAFEWVDPLLLGDYEFPPANSRLIAQITELEWPEWSQNGSQLWI